MKLRETKKIIQKDILLKVWIDFYYTTKLAFFKNFEDTNSRKILLGVKYDCVENIYKLFNKYISISREKIVQFLNK